MIAHAGATLSICGTPPFPQSSNSFFPLPSSR